MTDSSTDNPENPPADAPAGASGNGTEADFGGDRAARAARAAAVLREAERAAQRIAEGAPPRSEALAPPASARPAEGPAGAGPSAGRYAPLSAPRERPPGGPPSPTGMSAAEGRAALGELFAAADVPAALAARTAARLGPDAAAHLRADPWRLLRVPGVEPRQADHFARRLLGDGARPDDPRRGRALVLHLLTAAARDGHTVTPAADVLTGLERMRVPDPRGAVEAALDEAEVVALTEEPDDPGPEDGEDAAEPPEPEETLGAARWALAEEAAAEGLQRLTLTAAPLLDGADVRELRSGLPEDRSLAVTAAFGTGVCVLRGAPGAVDRAAVELAAAAASKGLRAAVTAPTDHAAAALAAGAAAGDARVTGLHRLLEPHADASPDGGVVFGRGEQNPLELDLLVVTGAGGLDVELCAVLVEACADGTHLVLCTADEEPPPVGPGRPLADLEASETVPVVELDAAPPAGPLEALTAAVRGGALAAVDAPGREVVIVPAGEAAEAVHRTVQLVTDSIPRALGIPQREVQVIASTAGGEAGATALNAALKARLNPGPGRFGGLDPGDRVVVAAPLPAAAPGEVGVVLGGGPHGLDVEFAAGTVTLAPAAASRLRHGWALTVGQARGTRHPAVVAVLTAGGLSRPLVATAFALAERHLSVVQAAGPALARAVRETGAAPRRTRLARLVVP